MEHTVADSLHEEFELIHKFCLQGELKMAVVESATAGFVQYLISSINEAGLFFQGGITTYTCQIKEKHLNIPCDVCDECNGVRQDITDTMAENVCTLFNADIGLAITGYASPVPEKDIYELFAFGSIYLQGKLVSSRKFVSYKEKQAEVQMDFAVQLVKECAKCLLQLKDGVAK